MIQDTSDFHNVFCTFIDYHKKSQNSLHICGNKGTSFPLRNGMTQKILLPSAAVPISLFLPRDPTRVLVSVPVDFLFQHFSGNINNLFFQLFIKNNGRYLKSPDFISVIDLPSEIHSKPHHVYNACCNFLAAKSASSNFDSTPSVNFRNMPPDLIPP